MRKIVMTVMLALAGVGFAQPPAAMTSFGALLPIGTLHTPADTCQEWAAAAGVSEPAECFDTRDVLDPRRALITVLRNSGYNQVNERMPGEALLQQQWRHLRQRSEVTLTLLYEADGHTIQRIVFSGFEAALDQ